MALAETQVVRVRCACGARIRVKNARPDTVVHCPRCGESIRVTREDLAVQGAGIELIPLTSQSQALLEARLIQTDVLRPARPGSTVGATGKLVHDHDEGRLNAALRGRMPSNDGDTEQGLPAGIAIERPFIEDLVASFYLCGKPRNAFNLAVTAALLAIPAVLPLIHPIFGALLGGLLGLLLLGYQIQFLWSVLTETAQGEDELALAPQDWDWWENAAKPMALLAWVSFICFSPALVCWYYADHFSSVALEQRAVITAAVVAGLLAWPMLLIAAYLDEPLAILRPDQLISAVFAVGPTYLLAWLIAVVCAVGISSYQMFEDQLGPLMATMPTFGVLLIRLPVTYIGTAVFLYFGYVFFRTLGLIIRHRQEQLPW